LWASGSVQYGSAIISYLSVCTKRRLARWRFSARFLRMLTSSCCAGFKVDRLPLVHDTYVTDQLLQAQESLGFAVRSVLAIPTLGRELVKTNPEVAPSRRQTSRVRKGAVLSSIGATPMPQTDGDGSPSHTGRANPSVSGSTTLLTCASLEHNNEWIILHSSPARVFETLSLLL
jgi:hypothetical protein